MTWQSTVAGGMAAQALVGRAGAAPGVLFLVLDLGRGCDPHQARCRLCHWRSRWRTTAAQARAEHASHAAAVHGRPARRGRRGRAAWGRMR
jgi:hypothetical protein